MKNLKKIPALIGALCLAFTLTAVPAFAADGDYSYTITISGGTQGTVNGSASVTATVGYGDPVNLSDYSVEANDGYYFKGFHEAGSEALVSFATATRNTTYVATYGKTGNNPTYTYTVHYIDRDSGEKIADDTTGTGFKNDQIVIKYKAIDDYMPYAYNEIATLKTDGQEFNYYYTSLEGVTTIETRVIQGETVYVYVETPGNNTTNNNTVDTNTADNGNVDNGNADDNNDADNGDNNDNNDNDGNNGDNDTNVNDNGDEDTNEPSLPEETINIDDNDVPLSDMGSDETSGSNGENGQGISTAGWIGIIVGAVVVAAVIVVLILLKKRKKDKDKNDDNNESA